MGLRDLVAALQIETSEWSHYDWTSLRQQLLGFTPVLIVGATTSSSMILTDFKLESTGSRASVDLLAEFWICQLEQVAKSKAMAQFIKEKKMKQTDRYSHYSLSSYLYRLH